MVLILDMKALHFVRGLPPTFPFASFENDIGC